MIDTVLLLMGVHVWGVLFVGLFVCVIAYCQFVLCFCVDILSRGLYGPAFLLEFNTILSFYLSPLYFFPPIPRPAYSPRNPQVTEQGGRYLLLSSIFRMI